MANIKFTNFAHSLLAVGIGPGDTSISVTGGHGARFPALGAGEYFYATLEDASNNREIVKVTARASDVLTVVRAQDNTSALSWNAGDTIALRLNAAAMEDYLNGVVLTTTDQTIAGTKTFTGNVVLGGTGNRIRGDFSNATIANRVMFQTSTVNGNSLVEVIPNGSGTQSALTASTSSSDPANASLGSVLAIAGTEVRFQSGARGTGTYLPMTFHTSGSERMRIDTGGNVGIGVTPAYRLDAVANTDAIGANLRGRASDGISVIRFADNANTETCRIDARTAECRITPAGSNPVLFTNTGGFGYGTGAGGTVTQGTSRTTGVTLNRPTGSITLVSAAGTTTWQSFTVTNSIVAATDTILVNQRSGTDLYEIEVTAVAAGSFRISFRTTGGTTTEQPVFNFTVIKGATS